MVLQFIGCGVGQPNYPIDGCVPPDIGSAVCPEDDCASFLADAILSAQNEVRCAFFDLEEDRIIEALETAGDHLFVSVYLDPHSSVFPDVPSTFYSGSYLMHHKFCVIDREVVITGSMNPTVFGTNRNNNHLLMFRSSEIARGYLERHRYLVGETEDFLPIDIRSCDHRIEAMFCKAQDCRSRVLAVLADAEQSIAVMAFSFTDLDVARSLMFGADQGVQVGVLAETRNAGSSKAIVLLEQHGVDVMRDNNPGSMHHKVFVIDNKTVITGSANPTGGGYGRNEEDLLIIHDEGLASRLLTEYERLTRPQTEGCVKSLLLIEAVLPDPVGSDKGQEMVLLINSGASDTVLRGYRLQAAKSSYRLSEVLEGGGMLQIGSDAPNLRNENGTMVLIGPEGQVDRVSWNAPGWPILESGDCVLRNSHASACDGRAWSVDKGCKRTKTFLKGDISPESTA
ncbi:MAG: phospholipase D-like domain-containing protein [archaeon]